MRHAFRLWSAISFSLLYSLAVVWGCFAPPKAWPQFGTGASAHSTFQPATAGQYDIPGIAPRTFSSVSLKTPDTAGNFLTGFAGRLSQLPVYRATVYVQYIYSFYNFLIRSRKADLIFPFHYFW